MILKVLVKSIIRVAIVLFVTYFVLFITGCAKDENIVNPSQSAITVTGKVTDFQGNGLGNIKVESKAGTIRTSSDGSFIFSNIFTPYDISVYTYGMNVVTFKNITTSKPQIPVNYYIPVVAFETNVKVIIPQMNNNQTALAKFYDTLGYYNNYVNISNSTYGQMNIEWHGSQSLSGMMVLWVYTTDNSGNILSYDKYGEKSISVSNGLPGRIVFNENDLNTNPADTSISGYVLLPSGFQITNKYIGMNRYPFANLFEFGELNNVVNISGTNYTVFIPALNGGIYRYYILIGIQNQTSYNSGMKLAEINLNNVNIVGFNTFPSLLSPEDNAQNVNYDTKFTFSKDTPLGIYEIRIDYVTSNSYTANRYIYTGTESNNINLLSDTSFNFMRNSPCFWNVTKYTGFNDIDDFISLPPAKNQKYREYLSSTTRTFKF